MKITTIKLSKETKERLEKLRVYKRESYDEILQEALDIIALTHTFPERARARIIAIERERRRSIEPKPSSTLERSSRPQNNPRTY